MAGAHIAALVNKKGRRVEDRNENGTIRSFEYADNVLADKNYGYNLDLGVNYHKSVSFIPFTTISFSSSRGRNTKFTNYTNDSFFPLYTRLKTICISAGVYF